MFSLLFVIKLMDILSYIPEFVTSLMHSLSCDVIKWLSKITGEKLENANCEMSCGLLIIYTQL